MTIEAIRELVEKVRDHARWGDCEAAHGLEDELHQRVLDEIACGAPHAAVLALEALQTRKIPFTRHCA